MCGELVPKKRHREPSELHLQCKQRWQRKTQIFCPGEVVVISYKVSQLFTIFSSFTSGDARCGLAALKLHTFLMYMEVIKHDPIF